LVVDIELAEGNGVAVIRAARQLYPPDAQPLIVFSPTTHPTSFRRHCFAAGADYFLDKMRDIALLKAVVVDGHSKWTPTSLMALSYWPALAGQSPTSLAAGKRRDFASGAVPRRCAPVARLI